MLNLFIQFNGNCREAVTFYAEAFGLEVPKMMTPKSAPKNAGPPLPKEAENMVLYTSLQMMGSELRFSDVMPGSEFSRGNTMSILVETKDMDEIKRLYAKLQHGGRVMMPLQETFFSKCYGILQDRYGVQWQFSHDSGWVME